MADTPNLIIVYASEAHTGTQLDRKTSMFELDFKLAENGCFCSDLSSLKTKKGPERPQMSFLIGRGPQKYPSIHQKSFVVEL